MSIRCGNASSQSVGGDGEDDGDEGIGFGWVLWVVVGVVVGVIVVGFIAGGIWFFVLRNRGAVGPKAKGGDGSIVPATSAPVNDPVKNYLKGLNLKK